MRARSKNERSTKSEHEWLFEGYTRIRSFDSFRMLRVVRFFGPKGILMGLALYPVMRFAEFFHDIFAPRQEK